MRTIADVVGCAIIAAVVIESLVGDFFLILIPLLIIAIAAIVYAHWPRKDYSDESVGLITPKGYQSLEPSLWEKIVVWLKTH